MKGNVAELKERLRNNDKEVEAEVAAEISSGLSAASVFMGDGSGDSDDEEEEDTPDRPAWYDNEDEVFVENEAGDALAGDDGDCEE